RIKPPVPRRGECPLMGLRDDKIFITSNAFSAILAVPKDSTKRAVVDYMGKDDFGKVPEYLSHVKAEVKAENDMVEAFVREQMGFNNVVEEKKTAMPPEEQELLLDQLKAKWDTVNARYQRMVHQTFFENGRLVAKGQAEKELSELEADIKKLSGGPVVILP
ncbi:unnamed protein product, partial [Discosporangium mesarthrocarpum]